MRSRPLVGCYATTGNLPSVAMFAGQLGCQLRSPLGRAMYLFDDAKSMDCVSEKGNAAKRVYYKILWAEASWVSEYIRRGPEYRQLAPILGRLLEGSFFARLLARGFLGSKLCRQGASTARHKLQARFASAPSNKPEPYGAILLWMAGLINIFPLRPVQIPPRLARRNAKVTVN